MDARDEIRGRAAPEHGDGGVAGDEPHEHEDDDAHPEEDRDDLEDAAGQVPDHSAPTPPSMVRALPVTKRASSEAR